MIQKPTFRESAWGWLLTRTVPEAWDWLSRYIETQHGAVKENKK